MRQSCCCSKSWRLATIYVVILASMIFIPVIASFSSTVLAAEELFQISVIEIQGNTLFSSDLLKNATRRYLGAKKTIRDLELIQNAVFSVYKNAGYTLVSVAIFDRPDSSGRLTVIVREDILRSVRINGNKYLQDKHIRQVLPALKTGYPINMSTLNTQILAANTNPSRMIAVALQTIDVGVFDAIVTVNEGKMVTHSISLDNTGDLSQDPFRFQYRFTHAGLGKRRDATGIFIYARSPNNNIKQYLAYYNQPLSARGDSLYLMVAYSDSDAGLSQTGIGELNVAGAGQLYSLHYVRPLRLSQNTKWALDFGLEYRNMVDNQIVPGSDIDIGQDIAALPFSITAQYNWQGKLDTVSANVTYLRNIPGGYLNNDDTYSRVRLDASARYQLWRGSIAYVHRFGHGWIFNNRYEWQYTTQPLIPDEQFGLGGAHSVRGFEEREALGDKGFSASFELYTPPLGHGIRLLAFYDIGQIWTYNFSLFGGGLLGPTTLSSTGIGLRWTINRTWTFNADYAYVLQGYATPAQDTRIHFVLNAIF